MVIAYREEIALISRVEADKQPRTPAENAIRHYTFDGLLQTQYRLALNLQLGTLSCFTDNGTEARLLLQRQFSPSELSVLLPLLESFPYYCPYETLYASFYNGEITDRIIEQSRRRLFKAQETGAWETEMRPVRNVLSRARIKLRVFGINISSIMETGCVLRPVSKTKASR